MLPSLLVSAAIAGSQVETRAQAERPAALELVVSVQASRLSLFNPTDAPEFVLLADREHGRRATITVPAHAELEFYMLERALDGLEFVVFARGHDGLRASSPLPIDALRGVGDQQATWFVSCSDHVHALTHTQTGWESLEGWHVTNLPPPCSLIHVPVITPQDGQHGGALPPRLEKKSLPAV